MSADVSPELTAKRRAGLARIDRMAWWLDDAFHIPVLNRRAGVDAVAGVVPFVGDVIGAGLSSLLVIEALRLGAPRRVWTRMGVNMGVDFVVGLVPIAGDLFDFYWKANRRNEQVLRRWLEEVTAEKPVEKKSNWQGIAMIGLGLAVAATIGGLLWRAFFA